MDLMDLPMWKKLVDASTILISLERIWLIAKACLLTEWNTGRHLVSFFFLNCKSKLENFTLDCSLPTNQAWIFLFRNCTIPNHNPEMRLLFQFFFYYHFSYKITWQVDYIHMYVWYIQLVSFQTLHTKKIWENKIYFH